MGKINGQDVHLCSHKKNPGYNQGQRFVVELKNNNLTGHTDDEFSNDLNEVNISVYCYDTLFSSIGFYLIGNYNGIELSDMIDYAKIVVTHKDGEPGSISIECEDVKHRLDECDVSPPLGKYTYDYRSSDSSKYCTHKDIIVN